MRGKPYLKFRMEKQELTKRLHKAQTSCCRAVAQAIGANGTKKTYPCHRVIGTNRSLTGYVVEASRQKITAEYRMPKYAFMAET